MKITILGILLVGFTQCSTVKNPTEGEFTRLTKLTIEENAPWSEKMAYSIMRRAPEAWQNDFLTKPRWNYTLGLLLNSMIKVGKANNNPAFFEYAKGYGDKMIDSQGNIFDYDIEKFNIDHVAPGPLLFNLWEKTKEKKYEIAINQLMTQLKWQPTTTEGGYWHKLRYPWQMWLDGLFMGEPFQAEYATVFNEPELFDHIANQFNLIEKHTKDPETGLLYHGWDESRIQKWANPKTGCSKNFWSRAMGWYCWGIIDVLEFFPIDHPRRQELVDILSRTLDAVLLHQDKASGAWWQVMNYPGREGNYLESTGSAMFTYALIKGVNEGYLPEYYRPMAEKSYEGLLKTFIRTDENGEVHLTNCCAVAGLGGDPFRDGSYEYYIGEPIRDNDPKGLGPFLLASLEIEKSQKKTKRN